MNFILRSIFIYVAAIPGLLFSSIAFAHTKTHSMSFISDLMHNFSHLSEYSGVLVASIAVLMLVLLSRR